MSGPLSQPPQPNPDGVADEWASVADALGPGTAGGPRVAVAEAPAHRSADLRLAMLDPGARRDLRRILIAFGAIGRPRPAGTTGSPVRPEDVVGAFVTADTGLLEALLRNAGAIRDEGRLSRFVEAIADVGSRTDPADPRAVVAWIADVGAILRDDAT